MSGPLETPTQNLGNENNQNSKNDLKQRPLNEITKKQVNQVERNSVVTISHPDLVWPSHGNYNQQTQNLNGNMNSPMAVSQNIPSFQLGPTFQLNQNSPSTFKNDFRGGCIDVMRRSQSIQMANMEMNRNIQMANMDMHQQNLAFLERMADKFGNSDQI